MKKLYILTLIFLPVITNAQRRENFSNAYLGAMIHENGVGISLANSFGIGRYAGVGAGVDVTSFCNALMVPAYLDIRAKLPMGRFIPYAVGQFGKPLYQKENAMTYTDESGARWPIKINGRHFFGAGAGFQYRAKRVWMFISYIRRSYKLNYQSKTDLPHSFDTEFTAGANAFIVGFAF
ncbi:hypothetical protein ACWKWU_20825 [Chitinophaga lutea]